MANSKGKKRERKRLQDLGLGWLFQVHPEPVSRKQKVFRRSWQVLLFLLTLIGLVYLWPWLSISPDDSVDPTVPYKTMFSVVNDGFIPATTVSAKCIMTFKASSESITDLNTWDNTINTGVFAPFLPHNHRETIPCFRHFDDFLFGNRPFDPLHYRSGALLRITIRYQILFILPKNQTFDFQSYLDANGKHHWEYH